MITYKNALNGEMITTSDGMYYALAVFKMSAPETELKHVVRVHYS